MFDLAQLIFRRHLPLDELSDLVGGLAQVLRHLADEILVDLDDLQFDLGDLSQDLRLRSNELPLLAGKAGGVPLQNREAGNADKILAVEMANPDQFPLNEFNLAVLGARLSRKPQNLLIQLCDALPQLRLLTGSPVQSHLKQLGLARHDCGGFRIARVVQQRGRKDDLVRSALFGLQARGARQQTVQALGDDRETRLGYGVVEADDNIAGLDDVAIFRAKLADDAAGRMLNLLHIGIDHDLTRRDERTGDFGRRRPSAKPPASSATTTSPSRR